MREANWDEIFQRRRPEAPADERLSSFLPWEDWLTFLIVTVMFMSVVHSVDSANWVDEMPSLYPIGFSALIVGYALSRVHWPEFLLHPLALASGGALVFLQLLAIVPGATPAARTDELLDRMYVWWSVVTQDGISTDPLPFIVLLLVILWLGSYVSSWAIFRWRNPWLGLIPGGIALMWNISFIPGQFSYSFVVFVFGAVLLVMRLHVARKETEWERQRVVYPEFLSLSVLNATFWVAVALLILMLQMPLPSRSDSAAGRWNDATAPLTSRLAPLGRVFISVNAKKPIAVHNLEDALALQGDIRLNDNQAVELDVEITPEIAAFLRAQSFDEYTSSGWKVNVEGDLSLAPNERAGVPDDPATRRDVTVNVTVAGGSDDLLFSLGQPVASDTRAEANLGEDAADITSLEPRRRVRDGDTYSVTGSVSIASAEQLRAAGTDYPEWVTDRYLDVPGDLPRRVDRKAEEVVGELATPYDQAAAIERYLRTFPNDFSVGATPPGRDAVDYFLFDVQRGYFDYHASAMAVLLRTLGIPARVATGYVVDPLYRVGESETRYELTEKSAYAWPEVYFPEAGWVEFNPTPSQPLINRPGAAPEPAGGRGSDRDPTLAPEEDIDLGINDPIQQPADDLAATDGGGSNSWRAVVTLAIVGGIAALLLGAGRFAWEYGLGSMTRPAQFWEKTQRLARWSRNGGAPNETPREFAARLQHDVPGTDGVGYLAGAYERTRFGHKELSEEETERLETAWASVRNGLMRRVLRLRPRVDDA